MAHASTIGRRARLPLPRRGPRRVLPALAALCLALAVAACERGDDTAALLALSRAGRLGGLTIQVREPLRAPRGATVTLTLAITSDLKGRLLEADDDGTAQPGGLLGLVAPLAELRAEDPALLLLDAGDTLAGWPLWRQDPADGRAGAAPHPVLRLMQRLGYDAMALGNQDFTAGRAALAAWRAQAGFPWLAANLLRTDGGTLLPPYAVLERHGVRIAVLGLTTPGAGIWADPPALEGLAFDDVPATVRRWLPVLRRVEQADVVLALLHSGTDGDYDREAALRQGGPLPDAAGLVADTEAGLDLVVSGHAHRLAPTAPRDGRSDFLVPVVQPGAYGRALSVVRITLAEQAGRWHLRGLRRDVAWARPVAPGALVPQSRRALAALRVFSAQPTAVRLRRVPSRKAFHACAAALNHAAVLRLETGLAPGSGQPPNARAGGPDAAAPVAYSLLPGLWRFDADAFPAPGAVLRRGHLLRWMSYDDTLVLLRLVARQMALLLEPWALYGRDARVRYGQVLFPGGLTPHIAPGGVEVLSLDDAATGAPLHPGPRYPVWLTAHHRNGGGGLAAMALVHPSQEVRRDPRLLRDLVFDLLAHPPGPLPPPCARFLASAPRVQDA